MPLKAVIPRITRISAVTYATTSGIEIIEDIMLTGLAHLLPLIKTSPIPKTKIKKSKIKESKRP